MSRERNPAAGAADLAAYYHRNGYTRVHDPARRAAENQLYKKGDEVRLVAHSEAELAHMRRLLRDQGFRPGRPFVKGRQFRQPVYGRKEVARFLALVRGVQPSRAPGKRRGRAGTAPTD